jgi:glycosyltransferase involved in cell wall biosynthesis
LAIFTAESRLPMGSELGSRMVRSVPYGIFDHAGTGLPDRRQRHDNISRILFMGALCEGKGIITLIEACALLKQRGYSLRVVCAGQWEADATRRGVEKLLDQKSLADTFIFPGLLLDVDKWRAYAEADIFCFPSHYVAESSPVVLTEAMSFGSRSSPPSGAASPT